MKMFYIWGTLVVTCIVTPLIKGVDVECGTTYTVGRGEIKSIDFHHVEQYPNNHDCTFHIRSLVSQSQVEIDFTHFDLEEHLECNFDNLAVYDGINSRNYPQLGKYCGSNIPDKVTTSGNTATVVFHSDDSVGGKGFRLTAKASDPNCRTYTKVSGTVQSPRYPHLYPNNANCTYDISPVTGSQILLKFNLFSMETSSGCQMDYLEVKTKNHYIGRYCGSRTGKNILVPSSSVQLIFVSDRDSARKGFNIDYKVVSTCADISDVCDNGCVADDNGFLKCSCSPGYYVKGMDMTCLDVNECLTDNGGCEEICTNLIGSFKCSCSTSGHFLSPNGRNCTDKSCSVDNAGCEHDCHLTGGGGYYCTCRSGYLITSGGHNCTDIDECKNEKYSHTCEHRCVNEAGSYYCECKEGFKLSSNGRTCDDVDECLVKQLDCSQQCTNTPGSWRCSCYPGYQLSPGDDTNCMDTDECSLELIPPHCSSCTNFEGGYYCECESGFTQNANQTLCDDVNECSVKNGGCDQVCINTPGSFRCACNNGYHFDASVATCVDTNECATNQLRGPCDHYCENTEGSFSCFCQDGYKLQEATGTVCVDVDECQKDNGNCGQKCLNQVGSFLCQCFEGYRMENNVCVDINECDLNPCDNRVDSKCVNNEGSFSCLCPQGYYVNGSVCEDIDECAESGFMAKHNCKQQCVNTRGGYECQCFPGYRITKGAKEETCQDIDECEEGKCQYHSMCSNTEGSFSCRCPQGFYLLDDQVSCSDVDECANSVHDCDQLCGNKIGYYTCHCRDGYTLNSNNKSCSDVDECATNNGGCTDGCLNMEGSYKCFCPPGHELQADNKTCTDIDECAADNGGCHHVCRNTPGSFSCSCLEGYSENVLLNVCEDINECLTENGGCKQTCSNSNGTYACSCDDNFKLGDDNKDCLHCPTCTEFEAVLADVATLKEQAALISQLVEANKLMSVKVEQLRHQVEQLQRASASNPAKK